MSIVYDFKSIAAAYNTSQPWIGKKVESTTLWLKFLHWTAVDMRWIQSDTYPTFETFKQHFIRGWTTSNGQPEEVGWLVQDEEPAADAVWNSEFEAWPKL